MKIDTKRILPYLLVPSGLRQAQYEKLIRITEVFRESAFGISEQGESRIAAGSYMEVLEILAALTEDVEACFLEPIAQYTEPK